MADAAPIVLPSGIIRQVDGRDPTPAQLRAQINAYLATQPGRAPLTDAQFGIISSAFSSAQPGIIINRGRTFDQVVAATITDANATFQAEHQQQELMRARIDADALGQLRMLRAAGRPLDAAQTTRLHCKGNQLALLVIEKLP